MAGRLAVAEADRRSLSVLRTIGAAGIIARSVKLRLNIATWTYPADRIDGLDRAVRVAGPPRITLPTARRSFSRGGERRLKTGHSYEALILELRQQLTSIQKSGAKQRTISGRDNARLEFNPVPNQCRGMDGNFYEAPVRQLRRYTMEEW